MQQQPRHANFVKCVNQSPLNIVAGNHSSRYALEKKPQWRSHCVHAPRLMCICVYIIFRQNAACVVPQRRHSLSFKRTQKNVSLLLSLKGSRVLNESWLGLAARGSRQTAAIRDDDVVTAASLSSIPINSLTRAP